VKILVERIAELKEANRVLRLANETLDAFTYVISHDLKAPIRAVDIILTRIREDHADGLSNDARALIDDARAANQRLSTLVLGLLSFSRASRAGITDAQAVALDDALHMDDCTTRFRDILIERGGILEYPGHDVLVHVHVPGLCQILGNLIQNAFQHNPKAHPIVRVKAKVAQDGAMIEVSVEDNGPGFPNDVIAGIDRMSTTSRGFGLQIAKRIVELTGGKLWLGESPERGGAVLFTLPAHAPSANAASDILV